VVAFRRLNILKARNLPTQGLYEAYYVDLSDILRHYIDDRFHLGAPELTTPEFIERARTRGIFTPEQQQMLYQLLRHCDYVKFAAAQPTLQQMEESYEIVRQFVQETTPRETEAEVKEAAA
jgi:hypothetical protein